MEVMMKRISILANSSCVFGFGGMGAAACDQATHWQASTAANGQPDPKDTGPDSKPAL